MHSSEQDVDVGLGVLERLLICREASGGVSRQCGSLDGVGEAPAEPTNWSKRYKQNVSLLTSGDIDNVALVVERLLRRKREKGLSAGETRMLHRAMQILDSEFQFRRHGGSDGELGGVRGLRTPRPLPSAGGIALPILRGGLRGA